MPDLVAAVADTAVYGGPTPSAQAWFGGGERVSYDPKARAIVAVRDAHLKIFERQEGDLAHIISFLPAFEHRQVDLAEERRGKLGLQIDRLPGGHLTTNEQPEALAALIAKFERGLPKMPESQSESAPPSRMSPMVFG
jgi:hypothetical protein